MIRSVYTVTQVNKYIKNMFTQDYMLQSVFVKGEVSNCKYHSSGHIYFTLKDESGTMACVMFAGYRNGLKFRLEEGQQVVAGGSVDVYERDGKYQLYARQIVLDGTGYLYEKFERLKRELEEQGMFDVCYKQKIPTYVKRLGVVTAPTGAAVRDIIQIASRRNPYVQIFLYPAIVQGDAAPESIVNGIRALEQLGVDVMIVGRGGGSIEDLWAFNERIVAQAVFDCTIPVISAVGHETDTTIVDYVADLRAPTPSAAAELAVYEYEEFQTRLSAYELSLLRLMKRQMESKRNQCRNLETRVRYGSPISRIREQRVRLINQEERLTEAFRKKVLQRRHWLEIYIERLKGLSPLNKLQQGYSYVTDETGKNIRDIEEVRVGDNVTVQLQNGEFYARVTGKEQKDDFGR